MALQWVDWPSVGSFTLPLGSCWAFRLRVGSFGLMLARVWLPYTSEARVGDVVT
jgi:hypothetical protein